MKVTTYAWLAGAGLLVLSGTQLVGVLCFVEPREVVILVVAGALLSWEGGLQRYHCRRVVGAIGALYLQAGTLVPALLLLSDPLGATTAQEQPCLP